MATDLWADRDDPNYRLGQSNIGDTADFRKLITYLNIPVRKDRTVISVILYSDVFYTGSRTSFEPDKLQGFSYYYYENGALRHMLFLRQGDNSFKATVSQLNCAAAGIDFGNMHRIARLFFRDHLDTVSAIGLNAIDLFPEPGQYNKNELGEELQKMEWQNGQRVL